MGRDTARSAALLGLFLASGCSALIYEIVWFQQLSLVLGASAISLAILLSSFMGGMCLGSLGFSRCVSTRHHPLRVYALLELTIGVCGLGTLWFFPVVGRVYCNLSLAGPNDLIARCLVAVAMLIPPTAMMGATLPAISRWVQSNRTGMAWLGWFYGANIFGAVIGSLFAGMYLLRVHDVYVATYVAVGINIAIAVTAFCLAQPVSLFGTNVSPSGGRGAPSSEAAVLTDIQQKSSLEARNFPAAQHTVESKDEASSQVPVIGQREIGVVHIVIGLSGLTALGAEIVWTRQLGLLLGPTVYTFSIILAVFLFGLGLGSSVGAVIGRRVRSPRLSLAVSQLLLMAAIPYAAYMIIHVVPYWLSLRGSNELFTVRVTRDVIRTLISLLPATFLWGASFPLAVAVSAGRGTDSGRVVGGLYAANTLGAIIGSLCVSLFAIPYGGQRVQQLLIVLCGISGILMLASTSWQASRSSRKVRFSSSGLRSLSGNSLGLGFTALLIAVVCCAYACVRVPQVPNSLLADGRYMNQMGNSSSYIYVAEGLDSAIVVSESDDGNRFFHVAGKVEASTLERDIRTQRMLGHLPAMAHPLPKKVLVVGCGSGMTAGSFLIHPSVEEIVLCEMEKCVIEASREYFADDNYGVLRDPRTRIVHDDARHFLATTRETFDIITTDPIHPWVKGAATLYTTEFFQLCKTHLNQDGIVTLWVPLYESNEATVKCEMATFLQEFPETTIWSGESLHVGYDLVVVGSANERRIDARQIVAKLSTNRALQISFDEVGLGTERALYDRFAANGDELKGWIRGAQINRDFNLRLQYLAGASPDHAMEQSIFQAMTSNPGKSPQELSR